MDMLAVMSPAAARTEQTRIAIEVAEGCATVGERVVWLTRREAQLLDYLVARRGAVVRREELQLRIWGAIIPGHQDRSLDAYLLRPEVVREIRGDIAERVRVLVGELTPATFA